MFWRLPGSATSTPAEIRTAQGAPRPGVRGRGAVTEGSGIFGITRNADLAAQRVRSNPAPGVGGPSARGGPVRRGRGFRSGSEGGFGGHEADGSDVRFEITLG